MRSGPTFPRGEWTTSPLRLFEGDDVQVQDEDGEWFAGRLEVVGGGLEILYDEPRPFAGLVESSRLLDREAAHRLRAMLRPATLWTDETRVKRDEQIWRAAHPGWRASVGRWIRELGGRDPIAAEPLLRRHLGRRVVVERRGGLRPLRVSGLLLGWDASFLALADTVLPAETALPLCPGRTLGADLEIVWNDEGIELFNRSGAAVGVLGLRTSEGLRPWDVTLRPGARERNPLRRAPAGTVELVFESPVRGDAVLPRAGVRVRGGSEGSIGIPALPDLGTRVGDLPEPTDESPPAYPASDGERVLARKEARE